MAMEQARHEEIMNLLNGTELTAVEKNALLDELRVDYVSVIDTEAKNKQTISDLEAKKIDLLEANSLLFRKIGVNGMSQEDQAKEEEKTFSETVTIEQLEGGK